MKEQLIKLIKDYGKKSERVGEIGELCSNWEWAEEITEEQEIAFQNILKFLDENFGNIK